MIGQADMMRSDYVGFDDILDDLVNGGYRAVVMCGLPGSGKSYVGERLRSEFGWEYLSSDKSRVEVLKLTVGKMATDKEYVNYKDKVYEYMREEGGRLLMAGKRVVFDATHLNDQRELLLDYLSDEMGLGKEEVLVIYVDGGERESVKNRIAKKEGKNEDGRSWVEAWKMAYDFFDSKIESGEVVIPKNIEKGIQVVWVQNH